MSYDASNTAILLVDPYNDFLAEGGKLWPRVQAVAAEVRLIDHLRTVLSAARASWGGTFHDDFRPRPGDVVAQEHWGSSGFAHTDLDLQLNQHGVRRIILIGLIANTCIEATGRFGRPMRTPFSPPRS